MTINKYEINSDSYWNDRFEEDWEACEGPAQSRFFTQITIEHLPGWIINEIKRKSLTLVDWGCGQGDGTDAWSSCLDPKQLTGVDFASTAIEQATQRYPHIRFVNDDWLKDTNDQNGVFDVVFSSNTLEHFCEPYKVLETLCSRAGKAIVLALPYRELERIDEHLYSFLPENIPLLLNDKFNLISSQVVDCRQLPETYWAGDQIILVYADSKWVSGLGLTLSDCLIEHDDTPSRLIERDAQIARLSQALNEREEQISNLVSEMAEAEGRLHEQEEVANAYKANADRLREHLDAVLRSRSWRLTKPLRCIARSIKHRVA
jgi:hypothetical protein